MSAGRPCVVRPSMLVMATSPVIAGRIFYYLDTLSLVRLASFSTLFEAVIQKEWRNRVLTTSRPFVEDVDEFYSLLGAYEGVVSGSVALAVLSIASPHDGFRGPGSDLDVYLPTDYARDDLVRHLIAKEGYSVSREASASAEAFWLRRPDLVSTLTRLSRSFNGRVNCIDLIVGAQHAATCPISGFWGSLVMNYISATSIVSVYPKLTLQGRFFTRPGALEEDIEDAVTKYVLRGFHATDIAHEPGRCTGHGTYCTGSFRYTEDAACLRVDWRSRGRPLPFGMRAPTSVPSSYWKWGRCQFVTYQWPFEDTDQDGCMAGRL